MNKKNWKIARRILVGILALSIVVTFSISRSSDSLLKATSVTEEEALYEEMSAEEQGLEEKNEEIVISGQEIEQEQPAEQEPEETSEQTAGQEPEQEAGQEAEQAIDLEPAEDTETQPASDDQQAASSETGTREAEVTVPEKSNQASNILRNTPDSSVLPPSGKVGSVKAASASQTTDGDSYTVTVGETLTITPPSGYSRTAWESSNTSVAIVSDSGVVTGLKEGTATITYKYRKSAWTYIYTTVKTYTVKVKAAAPKPSISVSPKTVTLTEIGETASLTASLTDISEENTIVWASSDKSVATVENGQVKAVSAGTCTITASVNPEEDELYGETYTASASVEVEFVEYDLYHYGLIPGAQADTNSSSADSRWFGLGVSKILGVKNPTSYNMGTIIRDYHIGSEVKALYPDLEYGGVTYKYAPLGSENAEEYGYYTLQPFRVTVSSGANTGYNKYNTYVKSGVKSYHLDYICILNEENNYSVNFAVKYPSSQTTEALTDYAQRVKEGTAISSLKKPSSGAVPQTMTDKGINYVFDGWYTDPGYTQEADLSGNVTGNLTFYGRYLATNARYRIEYYYDGVLDESQTVTDTADLGANISSYTDKPRTGFALSEVQPSSITVGNDESENVMRVCYTKRLVTYKVGYYLNGTDELISPQVTRSVKFGETGTGELRDIEGYTPVSDESTKTMTIEGAGTEIRFYYYKNVTLKATDNEFTYDGKEHEATGYTSSDAGASFDNINVSAKATDAGTYEVSFPEGTIGTIDRSSRYIVTDIEDGSLTINKAKVTVRGENTGKVYKATDPELNAIVTGVVPGDEDKISITVSRQEGENPGTYEINVSGEKDQGNYEVSFENGEFIITRANDLSIFANGYEGVFDGEPHTLSLNVSDADGTKITYSTDNGSTWQNTQPEIRDAGEITVMIKAENPGYETAEAQVTLKVSPKEVTVKAEDKEKTYKDADPVLTASVTGLIGDDTVDYVLSRENGEDSGTYRILVTADNLQGNYTIRTEEGNFTIRKKTIDLNAISSYKLYDGSELRGGVTSAIPEDVVLLYTLNEGKSWSADVPSIRNAGTIVYSVKTESNNYEAALSSGTLSVGKRTVILQSESAEKEYDGNDLTASGITVTGDGFAPGEGAEFDVNGSRKNPGSSENSFTYTLKSGTDPRNYNITASPGTLTIKSRSAKYAITVKANDGKYLYDGERHAVTGLVSDSFEIDGNTYFVSGLEAKGEGVQAGVYAVSLTGDASVTDTDGNDVTEQFAVKTEQGRLEIEKRKVTLTSSSASKTYDGAPVNTALLENKGITVSGDGFADGEGVFISLIGSLTITGTVDNAFEYTFMEGTSPSNYDITAEYGTLTVTDRTEEELFSVTVRAADQEAIYDGSDHKAEGVLGTEIMLNGHIYRVEGLEASAEAKDAGNYPVEISGEAVVLDEEGRDVTSQFRVNKENGTLTILRRTVIMSSQSVSKEYDGKPLTSTVINVTGDGFADGEGAEYTVTGSQTIPGSSENAFTYSLNESTKAQNYNIEKATGTLNVTDREAKFEVALKAVGGTYVYDGESKSVNGFTVNGGEAAEGDTEFSLMGSVFTLKGVSAGAEGTDSGSYISAVAGTPIITDPEGNDVTSQFIINKENGYLEIKQRNVILTSGSAQSEYNGDPLTNEEVTVSGDGFAPEEGASFDITGTQTTVGISENTFSYTLDDGTKAENYNITVNNGVLEVTSREAKYEVTVEGVSGSYLYDGKTHRATGLKNTEFYVDGNSYTISGLAASQEAVHAGKYPVNITGTAVVTDRQGNDVTDQFAVRTVPGTLEIGKRSVILTSASSVMIYDGSALQAHDVIVSGDGFCNGDGASFTFTGTRTLPGVSENTFTYSLNEGTSESDYDIRTSLGTLEITGRPEEALYEIQLTAAGGEFLYDGEDHEVKGFTVNGGSEVYENGSEPVINIGGHDFILSGASASNSAVSSGSYDVN